MNCSARPAPVFTNSPLLIRLAQMRRTTDGDDAHLRTTAIIAVKFCSNFASEDAFRVDKIFSARSSTPCDPAGSWKKVMTIRRRIL
jgi:hypothetical protein